MTSRSTKKNKFNKKVKKMDGMLIYMAGIITGVGFGLIIAGIYGYILTRRKSKS